MFILEAVDRVEPDAAGALLYLLDPARRIAFRDAYLDVAFNLSAVLWIVTATDPDAIPEPVREHLAVSSCRRTPRRRSWRSRNSTC